MEVIVMALFMACVCGEHVVDCVRTGEAYLLFGTRVTRADDVRYFWGCVVFWLLGFAFFVFFAFLFAMRASSSEPPFDVRGLWPDQWREWLLAAIDAFCLLMVGRSIWLRIHLNHALREVEAKERSGA